MNIDRELKKIADKLPEFIQNATEKQKNILFSGLLDLFFDLDQNDFFGTEGSEHYFDLNYYD